MNQYHYNLIYTLNECIRRLRATNGSWEDSSESAMYESLDYAVNEVLRDAPVIATFLSVSELNLGIAPTGTCKNK